MSVSGQLEVRPPASREEILAEISRLAAVIEAFASSMDTATFFAPQIEDGLTRWSPAEQIRHLTRSTYPLARGLSLPRLVLALRFGLRLRRPQSYAQVAERYARFLREERPQAGRFAPSRDEAAPDDARRAQIMARFRDAVSRLAGAVERWPERALDRYRVPHPLLGGMSVREMLFFTAFHTAHHGSQIARRAAPAEAPNR